uniref:Uncharacterized protein n=1 Tax=Anopheles quadriannulatus TaxID=34691 RepID=A0A182XS49_ANOQN
MSSVHPPIINTYLFPIVSYCLPVVILSTSIQFH